MEMLILYRIGIYSLLNKIKNKSDSLYKMYFNRSNYQKDGAYSSSHFVNDKEFNSNCADLIIEQLEDNAKYFKNYQSIQLIDLGCGSCDLMHCLYRKITAKKFPFDIEYNCIEVDKQKLSNRKETISSINYINNDHRFLRNIYSKGPCIIIQRALTHYFCDQTPQEKDTPFTPEQLELYISHLKTLHPGSLLIDIISTGQDQIGLRRFEYLLYKIADKKLHYLTPETLNLLVNKANSYTDNKARLITCKLLQRKFGQRDFNDLYKRYANRGELISDFKSKLNNIYNTSKSIFNGKTEVLKKVDIDNYQINILFYLNCFRIEKS